MLLVRLPRTSGLAFSIPTKADNEGEEGVDAGGLAGKSMTVSSYE